tara:strand:+ start:376 stop:1059 length:684 start_codon:yes stop_codon:yes gene_type:complete
MTDTFRPFRTCDELQPLADQYWRAGNWSQYLFTLNNGERAAALLNLFHHVERPSRLWPLVNEVWSMSNCIFADEPVWDEIWANAYRRDGTLRRCHRFIMRPADRRIFDALPETVTVYRGCNSFDAIGGYSWTLSKSVAESFAHRVSRVRGEPLIATVSIPRWCLLAYFDERSEQEIVVDRQMLDGYGFEIDVEAASPKPDTAEDTSYEEAGGRQALHHSSGHYWIDS